MSLRYGLLGLLAERPRTGYSLLKHFEGSLNFAWPASHSQIYPELARLVEAGMIRQIGVGPRGAKTYEATEAGVEEVRRWLRSEPDRAVRSEPGLRLFFLWLLEPGEVASYLRRERDAHRSLLASLERIEGEQPEPRTRKERSYRMSLEAGLRTTRARLEWAEWALEYIASW